MAELPRDTVPPPSPEEWWRSPRFGPWRAVAVGWIAAILALGWLLGGASGAGIALVGLVAVVVAVVVRLRRAAHSPPSDLPARVRPWEDDRPWQRRGESRSALSRNLPVLPMLVAFGVWVVLAVSGVLGGELHLLGATAAIVLVTLLLTRAWLQGGIDVLWDEFPMRTGSRVRFHIATTAGGASITDFAVVLRCVEAKLAPGNIPLRAQILTQVPPVAEPSPGAGAEEYVTIEFDISAAAPGTDFSRRGFERRWELVVLGKTAWGKIAETFVVPIYAVRGETAGGAAPASEV